MATDKDITKYKLEFFASCPTGLEEILQKEINDLGIDKTEITKGGVHIGCYNEQALQVLIYSRVASRVFRKLYGFSIRNEKDIFKKALKIKWKAVFGLEQTFKITTLQGTSPDGKRRSHFKSSIYLSQQLKDGIVDNFRNDTGERPSVYKEDPDISFLMRVNPDNDESSKRENVLILIDLCGTPLSHRGYRERGFIAPVRENVAAGILKILDKKPEEAFIDCMCGSGTFLIEQALIDRDIPPSFLKIEGYLDDEREWSFQNHYWYEKDKLLKESFSKIIKEALKKINDGDKVKAKPIVGFDIVERNVDQLKKILIKYELDNFIRVKKADATDFTPLEENSLIFCNPPYGERLEEENDEKLEKLYYDLGENFKNNCKNSRAYVFTGNLPLIKKISLRTSKKIQLYNGAIESRLVEYLLY